MPIDPKDHLFISYAIEDHALARWLTLKLTSSGYRVWCDQFNLLGGESYPADIDYALKNKTFRMLALLSRSSIQKPNPRKERTLALNIARERQNEFIIPINVDGLKPTELEWMTSDLTFIPFYKSWAVGLSQLLLKLKSIPAPITLENGRSLAAETFLTANVLRHEPEIVFTNWLELKQIPENIFAHRLNERPGWADWQENPQLKTAYRIDPKLFLSFSSDLNLKRVVSEGGGAWRWQDCNNIFGVKSENIVSSLLRRNIYSDLLLKGLQYADEGKTLFFPRGLLQQEKIFYLSPSGKQSWTQVVGNRTFSRGPGIRETCSYHLSLRFTVRQDLFAQFVIEMKISIHLLDQQGQLLRTSTAHSRRRKITKFWHNFDWLKKYFAALSFIGQGSASWIIDVGKGASIEIATKPLELKSPIGINETMLESERKLESELENVVIQIDSEEEDDE